MDEKDNLENKKSINSKSNNDRAYEENNMSIYHVPSFLLKLFEIVDSKVSDHIVGWNEPDNDGFIIKNINLFCEQILP